MAAGGSQRVPREVGYRDVHSAAGDGGNHYQADSRQVKPVKNGIKMSQSTIEFFPQSEFLLGVFEIY